MNEAQKLYDPKVLRSYFPKGADLHLGGFEIFEHPLYGDEADPLAIGYSVKWGREIVFDVFISGDDYWDCEECKRDFQRAEDALMGGAL